MAKLIIILLFILAATSTSIAAPSCRYLFDLTDEGYLFGLEFTFTTEEIVNEGNRNPKDPSLENNPIKAAAWKKWYEGIQSQCRLKVNKCRTIMSSDKHGPALKVIFTDGFYFTVGVDSAALEVNAFPKTRTGFQEVKARMDKFVFASARKNGLRPHIRAGQGHIHISRIAFQENMHTLRNFFVDFQNRPELIYGALGNHLYNSPPVAALKPHQRDALQRILNDPDSKEWSINQFIIEIQNQVYTETTAANWGGEQYYHAFNMTRMFKGPSKATLEIRSFRPQESTHVFELQTKLLERWIQKSRDFKGFIPYIRKDSHVHTDNEIVAGFKQLLEELDLPFNEFKVLLPPNLRKIAPDKKFESVPYILKDES